jgi:hypothetical protein
MSGDGKRGAGHRPQATAPILDSTGAGLDLLSVALPELGELRTRGETAGRAEGDPELSSGHCDPSVTGSLPLVLERQ